MNKNSGHSKFNVHQNLNKNNKAFTIVELLVVIVVIGILAAITIVSYSGISRRAIAVSLQNDLDSASKLLKMYNVEHGYYPSSLGANDCPATPDIDNRYCIKASTGNDFAYTGGGQTFTLTNTHTSSGLAYEITESSSAVAVESGGGGSAAATFAKVLRLSESDRLNAGHIIQSADGGYVVAGAYYIISSEVSQNFIIKYDAAGSLSWNKNWNVGYNNSRVGGVAQVTDGGYVIAGDTSGVAFVSKFSSAGSLSWTTAWQGASDLKIIAATRTSDNGFILAGETYNSTNDNDDLMLMKVNADGDLSWSKIYAASSYEAVDSVIQTSDGGYMIVGNYPNGDSVDIYALKTTSDGSVSWAKTWGSAYDDENQTIIQTTDGGYLIGGYYYGSSGVGFLTKLNSDGSYAWSSILGTSTKYDSISSMVQNSDGTYTVVGSTDNFQTDNADVIVSKFSTAGVLTSTQVLGSNIRHEMGVGITKTSGGGYAVVGTSSGMDGYIDMMIVRMGADGLVDGCAVAVCRTGTLTSESSTTTVTNRTFTASALSTSVTEIEPEISSPTPTSTSF